MIKPCTTLFFKVLAVLIAGRTGSTFDAAESDLSADVGLFTTIPMDAEVLRIEEEALSWIVVRKPVFSDLLGDRAGIFAQKCSDFFERSSRR